ncbi:MAG: NTP transferase domain-containing protein, partial [Nanoarchaeota archaeon]
MEKEDIQIFIPAAGSGNRFVEAGYKTPKYLLNVDNQAIIEQIIDMFPGVNDISLIVNDEALEDNYDKIIQIAIDKEVRVLSIPKHKKGPVYSVSQIFNQIDNDKPIIVSYCDCISYFDFDKFLSDMSDVEGGIVCGIGFHYVLIGNDPYAVCFQKNGIVTEVREKYLSNDRFNEYTSSGIYFFKSGKILKKYFNDLVKRDINIKGEYYVSLVYNKMIEDGLKIKIFEAENVINLGTPVDFEEYKGWSNYFHHPHKSEYSHNDEVTLIVPMAGLGKRFQSENYKLPKPLIEVDGKPMFIKAIESIPRVKNKIFVILVEHVISFGLDIIIRQYYPDSKILVLNDISEGQAQTCELAITKFNLDLEKPILEVSITNPFKK